ncbi:TPA: acyltransferase [Citrobacter freundii]|nr:acyltransferase [Citrobacter freundii]HCD2017277.1 acyltransferase [Citrobacter freundii]HCD3567877.1 acyltransferase [Citrobacter freundii]HCD6020949.1 acyltransferase [Citrobacter freundii]
MLLSLQYLRGIASLLVVLYHARGEISNVYAQSNLGELLFGNGYIGVDLFFMISGFVIMLSTEKDKSSFSFIIKRLFRIYPVYLVFLFALVFLQGRPFDVNLLKSLLFINLDLFSEAPWFGYTIIFTAWTLMFEIIFYMLFYISLALSWKYRGYICMLLIASIVLGTNLYFNGSVNFSGYSSITIAPNQEHSIWLGMARVLSSPMFFEFIIGMVIYKIYASTKINISNNYTRIAAIIAIALFSYFYVTGYNGGHGPLSCGVYAAILLLALVLFEKTCNVKYSATLSYFGNISYSLYLTHALVMNILPTGIIPGSLYSQAHGFSNLYLILLASIFISTILYYTVEVFFVRFARMMLKTIMIKNTSAI